MELSKLVISLLTILLSHLDVWTGNNNFNVLYCLVTKTKSRIFKSKTNAYIDTIYYIGHGPFMNILII